MTMIIKPGAGMEVGEVVEIINESVGVVGAAPAWRWWRWVVDLGERIAFVAEDAGAWARLERERVVLGWVGARVVVSAVEVVDDVRRVQVRRKVPGICGAAAEALVFGTEEKLGAEARYREDCPLTAEGRRLARDLGAAMAAMHGAVEVDAARAMGVAVRSQVAVLDSVGAWLAGREDLADLRAAVPGLRAWFAGLGDDLAVCHGDLQMHNIAVEAATGRLAGLFDFDDMAVTHRLEDFKYLPSFGVRFTEEALEAYARGSGRRFGAAEVGRFHLLAALEHFLFVPEEAPRWPSIVGWCRAALARFGSQVGGVAGSGVVSERGFGGG